ncbi:HNH endonuclease [Paenibacillus sp. BR2-3]|uniref:HNH endonuclease n=1 Tax=Paenibacillus sp. BR2-3 TaxID=3048494 RepID=UPI003977C8DB
MLMTQTDPLSSKPCAYCLQHKPLTEFRRRTGKRSKGQSRRGACRTCRKLREAEALKAQSVTTAPIHGSQPAEATKSRASQGRYRSSAAAPALPASQQPAEGMKKPELRPRRPASHPRGPKPEPQDTSALIPSSQGMILMRGHSDKGRRWHQEIDLDLAVTLVKEHAAVVVNRRTIRRLYSNKDFRSYILTRDDYTCHFCGLYGDTIDHLLPRAKGGHTTPDNCVCACNLCNQTKADQYVEEFLGR